MYLEKIRQLKEEGNYDKTALNEIADQMEDLLTPTTMWNTLRPAFELDEFIENLEYIAKECDI